MFANKRERLEAAGPGSIIAVAGLKATYTGDTLCPLDSPIQFESLQVPTPVIDVALEARSSTEEKKLTESLEKLLAEDPTFRVRVDEETGQTLLSGMGELHLDVLVRRLLEEFGVQVKAGKPQVVYRETISQAAEAEGVFDREVLGKAQFAQAVVRVEPLPRGAGLKSEVRLRDAEIPPQFWPVLEQSISLQAQTGPLRGYQVVDALAQVVGGSYNEAKSTELAYEVAAAKAFQAALERARPLLLEPIMRVEVVVPEDFLGAVIHDLGARRGKVEAITDRGRVKIVRARAPLSRLFGYSTDLRSTTQGRATYSMHFSHYDAVSEPAPSGGG
jgi:elongation factor G